MLTEKHVLASLPMLDARHALFLDIDGTLAPIAPKPELAVVPEATLQCLAGLQTALGGAVAVVSGRSFSSIDAMLSPLLLPAAGQHGLELRVYDALDLRAEDGEGVMEWAAEQVAAFHLTHPRLLVEYKGLSIALHTRAAPELGDEACEFLLSLMKARLNALVLQTGKMVCEIRLKGLDKGSAMQRMLQVSPFLDRIPVFAGDDATDEHGFDAVEALGGVSIKVGRGKTRARHRLESPAQLQRWLQETLIFLSHSAS